MIMPRARFLLLAALISLVAAWGAQAPAGVCGEVQKTGRDLPNLVPFLSEGWDFPLVPRDSDDATVHAVHLTPTLPGNVSGTYWNSHIINDGDAATGEGFVWWIHVDGNDTHLDYSYTTQSLPSGLAVHSLNKGPRPVAGGRHTFEIRIDEDNNIPESNELDNDLAYQFIWTPYLLDPGTRIYRDPPPDESGGWGSVPAGEVRWYNCDGYRFTSSGWWNAVWISAQDEVDDYDCRLHVQSAGCRDGFAANIGYSTRPAGYVDAVLVNRNTMGQTDWDVGVLNDNGGDSLFMIEHVQSREFTWGDQILQTLPAGEAIHLWEFYLTSTNAGWVMFELETDSPLYELGLYHFDESFTVGDLGDNDGSLYTTDGFCRDFRELASPGYHCVGVMRDQAAYTAMCDYSLLVTRGWPDFTPNTPPGWHSACVPRPDTGGTPTSAELPDTLYGNAGTTYANVAMRNATPVPYPDPSPYMKMYWEYDERPLGWIGFNPIDGLDTIEWNSTTPGTIAGGRHTYALRIDKYDEITEMDEENNDYGEQYCWSPAELPTGMVTMRSMPASATAGWALIHSGEPAWYNCDGLRIPRETTYWVAMAVLPVAESDDVDVRLHETLVGVKDGFAANLDYSDFGPGESDYVIVNFNVTSRRAFDFGVVTYAGDGTYRAHAIKEEYLATYPNGTYGPFSMSSLALLRLHEMGLEEGQYLIRLDQQSGTADLGMTLHQAEYAYQWKGQCVSGGFADDGGPGQDEELVVTIPADGYYCLAIWKCGSSDLNLTSTYELQIVPQLTAVPGAPDVPAVTRLTGVHPNPFNPRTKVAFDLARDDLVVLNVFDVLGRKVRCLLAERMPAGHHAVPWDGRDDAGQPVASGTYLARLEAGPAQAMEKMMLVR
jgi:hypothetical protein